MKKISLAYFGSPVLSADFLEKLITDSSIKHLIKVDLVVTQPDRKVGRKQILTATPVKEIAIKNNINVAVGVASEETLREADFRNDRKSLAEEKHHERQNLLRSIDLALIYFYGQIIPEEILRLPKYGFWNIHFSALPKYRGPAPVVYSLIMGDQETAVTFIQTDAKLDHGDIIAQQPVKIKPTETKIKLEERLHNVAYEMFIKLISGEKTGIKPFIQQNHSQATYARFPTKADGFIPLDVLKKALSGEKNIDFVPPIIKNFCQSNHVTMLPCNHTTIFNLFRAFSPWPGIWTMVDVGKTVEPLRLRRIRQLAETGKQRRLKITDMALTGNKLIIKSVQLEGKREVDFSTFNQAYKIF